MAHDMRGSSWKSLASTHLAPIKDYLTHRGPQPLRRETVPPEIGCISGGPKKHSWTQFAGQRLVRRSNSDSDVMASAEKIVLLPGWASRRYRAALESSDRAGAPYDVEVFVSGYVVKHKAPNALSRPQRTLLRLAKHFASLPKLPYDSEDPPNESDAFSETIDELSSGTVLPTRLDEIIEESERHALRDLPNDLAPDLSPMPISAAPSSGFPSESSTSTLTSFSRDLFRALPSKISCSSTDGLSLHRWHSNLETRLHPFWAGVLPNRAVRITVRPHFDISEATPESVSPSEWALLDQPLATQEAVSDASGAFKLRIVILWEDLCTHPRGAPIAFVDPNHEHDFSLVAELIPLSPSLSQPQAPKESHPFVAPALAPSLSMAVTTERVPLTYSPIRVISDIDDTVKLSGVSCGARAVFHNVFVKDLEENLIPGMGEWYSEMWRRGVRFHYVSNGPFELLPVINDFFRLARLPAGSVRLRSYGTRTLFSGLLSAAADRKRDGVLEVLTSFPNSRFILIGDSGEQDLELYANLAHDYPEQILCIFIRDVNTYEDGGGGIEDPTGLHAGNESRKRSSFGSLASRGGLWSPKSTGLLPSPITSRPPSESTTSTEDYSPRTSSLPATSTQKPYTDVLCSEPSTDDNLLQNVTPITRTASSLSRSASVSESDKKRANLQMRLWRACAEVPAHVVIRVFRDPQECVEASRVIDPHLASEST
ncbi:hypothetical protein BJV78DRAFT_1358435 [Lactifluus subvellereus]|nr:hypothetical protein BJV78DRAFT_1358435 [Lactifluus subvellereus]